MHHIFSLPQCRALSAIVLTLSLDGCAVGPDYQPAAPPTGKAYESSALPLATAQAASRDGAAQFFRVGEDLPDQWWTLYRAPALDRLIRQALEANPDLKAADAALRQGQELAAAERGGLLPSLDASASQQRNRSSGAAQGQPAFSSLYNVTSASLSVSYNVDVFGGTRRAIEASEAQSEYQRWQREASILTLTANIVTAAIDEASLRAQIDATQRIIADQTDQLTAIRRQFAVGGASRADILAQDSLLAQSKATLPSLEKQLHQQRHLLATYLGRSPADEIDAAFDLDALSLPVDLPVTLPARLVQQRPDILAAAANLHYASAEVGVAVANQWPQLTLSADYGTAAATAGQLFTTGAAAWGLGASLAQPIFHGGALGHRRAAAEAAFDQANAQYQSTVLTALRNVADSLRALQSDAETLQQQQAYADAADRSMALTRQRYALGAVSHVALLDAQRSEAQARLALIAAQAARLSDSAALFQALGGGWWNRPDSAAPPPDLIGPLF